MQFRRQPIPEESINLTPLIDVVFLLLIFFMVSTTFTKETHLQIDLPEASVEPVEVAVVDSIDIVVSANGDYSINGKTLVNQQAKTLQRALKTMIAGNKDKPIHLTADATASHQAVVRAMDVAGQLGVSQMKITTRQPVEE
ncbi:biopolymer transporter ExbD [Candidatus Endobugula sertula]|uniref:Biopolymer transporter ExbD n=1 Tax=Candidatus Endobugula sertula TaxID=62101 RepID=A0A1D2QR81_9GAMM|nr:biopolymer transporter ExbD [Candidatus Endobugula sertula]